MMLHALQIQTTRIYYDCTKLSVVVMTMTIMYCFIFKSSDFLKRYFLRLDLHIPVITEDAILPVPIKPKIIIFWLLYIDYIELINKKRSSNS